MQSDDTADIGAATGPVFLSYAGVDVDVAERIAEGLRSAGADVWWDRGGIGWGDNWIDKLQDTLGSCRAYLILVGRSGVRRWVKAELYIAVKRHFGEDLPIFSLRLPGVSTEDLPPFLGIFQSRSLPERLEGFDFASLAETLRAAGVGAQSAERLDPETCPFPGLEAFREKDARFFFGRQSETLDALRRLGPGLDGVYRRWLQVEGASGVGKSSVILAGVVPAIKRGWMDESARGSGRRWLVAPSMRPGADPVENLAEALARALSTESLANSMGSLCQALGRPDEPDALRHLLRQHVPTDSGFLLVVDQLEEAFTMTEAPERAQHFAALLAAALDDGDGPLHLITTIRSDFMAHFGALPALQELLNERAARYLLQPIGAAGLRDVVRTPARLAGLRWSEDTLPDLILEEASAERGALPLVGYLLRLLWQRREGAQLSARVYHELGGVGGALARSADALLESLGREGKECARKLLLELVKPGRESQDTRRTVALRAAMEAAGSGPDDARAREVLDRLSGVRDPTAPRGAAATPRLVVVWSRESQHEGGEADTFVDLAHEALLRDDRSGRPYWKTLREWVDRYRKQLEERDLLDALAQAWHDRGRPRLSGLASGRQLREFHHAGTRSAISRDYLRASGRMQWLRRGLAGVVATFAVAIAATAAWLNREGLTVEHARTRVLFSLGMYSILEPQVVEIVPGSDLFPETAIVGSPEDDVQGEWNERPAHEVRFAPFAIGVYEVTFEEYDAYAYAVGLPLPADQGWGRGRRPAINVSWEDAVAYARWLSANTASRYRLPSEAEWEYAARAGTSTSYWWGDTVGRNRANCDGCGSEWDLDRSAPVGSFAPNPFGLHDTAGNVWELVQDCAHSNYDGAPVDGSAWEDSSGACSDRMMRGGSWQSRPWKLRSVARYSTQPDARGRNLGFRLVREIE